MDIFSAVLLGIIQGITEFLPVSSTGHLIVAEHILGVSQKTFGLPFDVSLHIGSALALIIIFKDELLGILSDIVKRKKLAPLAIALIAGTIPGGLAGLLFEKKIEQVFRSPTVVAISLIVFSALLLLGDYLTKKNKQSEKEISWVHGLVIGFFQGLAIIPGVSRSGSTITGGLSLGYNRETSTRFAFLLSIPIILLAGAKTSLDIFKEQVVFTPDQILFFFVGFLSSAITAFIAIRWFLKLFPRLGFFPFVIYRIIVAILILLFVR